MDYRIGGMELSAKSKVVIQKMVKGQECNFESSKSGTGSVSSLPLYIEGGP